jgi:sugar fermentation stimulation protein A
MIFEPPLQKARLIKRYKRFLADVVLADGSETTLHCPNTGAMTRCQGEGWPVWYSDSGNPKRKYPCTWQIAQNEAGDFIGINSALANTLVHEALREGRLAELAGHTSLRSEVAYGDQNSRIDFLLSFARTGESDQDCYVEVKSLTLGLPGGLGVFPDAVTTRGQKHLEELMAMRAQGARAALVFCVQHTGVNRVSVARDIDASYAQLLEQAVAAGVEVLAYGVDIAPEEQRMALNQRLPFAL